MGIHKTKLFPLVRKSNRKKLHKIILVGAILFSALSIIFVLTPYAPSVASNKGVLGKSISKIQNRTTIVLVSPVVEITLTPTLPPAFTPTPTPIKASEKIASIKSQIKQPTPTSPPKIDNSSQYTAEKIDETTWKVQGVASDSTMASSQDIVNAINSYRSSHGVSGLSVDPFLTTYAQERANLFTSQNSLDSHAGFRSFMDNDGFTKAGFNSLGENSAFISGPMEASKIVKSIFGADPAHDGNQLADWTHIGVGVNGNAINVNFGKGKR